MSTELPFPIYLPNCQIIECQPHQGGYILVTHSTDQQANCPCCQHVSSRLHGFYYRKPTDLPLSDKPVQLRLRLRRFRCLNPACPKRTFGQPCPDWLPAFARRTNRLAHAQRSVAMMLGGQAGSRLLTHLYMPTSHDTLLRLIRRWQPGDAQTPHALGVDDWAIRKAKTYGTILVDLDKHGGPPTFVRNVPSRSNHIPDPFRFRSMRTIQAAPPTTRTLRIRLLCN